MRDGLSLMELVVVLFVMSVLSAVAVPLIARGTHPLRDEVSLTLNELRAAHRYAMQNGRREALRVQAATVIFYPTGEAMADTIRLKNRTIVVDRWSGDAQVQ